MRVDVPLDMSEVSLRDRHVVRQFQVWLVSHQYSLAFSVATFALAIANQPVVIVARRVCVAQSVDQRLLHKICDDEDQKGHAVRVVLAEAEPLGKLGAELGPPRVASDNLKSAARLSESGGAADGMCGLCSTVRHACLRITLRERHQLCHLGSERVHADDALESPRVGVEQMREGLEYFDLLGAHQRLADGVDEPSSGARLQQSEQRSRAPSLQGKIKGESPALQLQGEGSYSCESLNDGPCSDGSWCAAEFRVQS